VVKNSQFDNNEDGFDTNSQNGDNPPPQNGACPNNGISPITHTHSCWVFMDNYVHDNNNPNVPTFGSAAAGPVGTGMSISGGRHDTVMNNTFANNGAWGTIFVIYPDSGPPCTGGINLTALKIGCIYDDGSNALLNNKYSHNGFFGNPSNSDYAELALGTQGTNCFRGNTELGGRAATTSRTGLEPLERVCGVKGVPDADPVFTAEVACDSTLSLFGLPQGATCPPGSNYPRQTQVVMHPLPANLPTMPNPCSGVPANPWCGNSPSRN
jgi:hypothetical protein